MPARRVSEQLAKLRGVSTEITGAATAVGRNTTTLGVPEVGSALYALNYRSKLRCFPWSLGPLPCATMAARSVTVRNLLDAPPQPDALIKQT